MRSRKSRKIYTRNRFEKTRRLFSLRGIIVATEVGCGGGGWDDDDDDDVSPLLMTTQYFGFVFICA